jgi:membrane protein implicated in regulation of membrane protease activity
MDAWMIWAVVAVVLVIIEMFTPSFFFVCLAAGGLLGAAAAALGLTLAWQLVAFAAGSTAAFLFIRPVMMKYFLKMDRLKTGVDALVGRVAKVSEALEPVGRVAIDGDDWRAIEADGAHARVGDSVEIVKVESATLHVKRLPATPNS